MTTSTAIQNANLTASGGADQVVAPCASECFRLHSGAHSFTFQYADTNGNPVGAGAAAEELSSTCFEFRVISARNQPFTQNQIIGFLVGTGSDTIAITPDRFPG